MFTKEYIKELQKLHGDKSRPNGFGGKKKKLGKFYSFMDKWQPATLLDYGCGKGLILADLRDQYITTTCEGYDPAVPMFNNVPSKQYECVFSNDVLEHIEPKFIVDVLTHIDNLASKYVWLRIDTMPARKTLSDGRNAHLILESNDWWHDIIKRTIKGNIVYAELDKKGKFDIAIEK